MAGKKTEVQLSTMDKVEMRKALDEYVDSLVEKVEGEETKPNLAKSEDCEDEDLEKKKAKKYVEKAEDEEAEDEEAEDEEAEDEEGAEKTDSTKNSYKKGFMEAIKRMKDKSTKKSLEASRSDESDVLLKTVSALTERISSLTDTVEKLSKQPASTRRSIRGLDVIKKSRNDAEDGDIDTTETRESGASELLKSRAGRAKVADIMFQDGFSKADPRNGLQITAHHIAEFESTGRISDPRVQNMVKGFIRDRENRGLI